MRSIFKGLSTVGVSLALLATGCREEGRTPPAQTAQADPPSASGQPLDGPAPHSAPPSSALYLDTPPSQQPGAPVGLPLLPLIGALAWQAEARAVVKEVVSNLEPQYRASVTSVPMVFDPNPNEVNAFAACDDSGAPFIAGTEGLLEAIDAISQTKASDELFGLRTYDAYTAVIAPRLASKDGGSAMLPLGVVPPQVWLDPRRITRAHQMFDEIVAFTFGHELSHHYLGHTGCANRQAAGVGPSIAQLGRLVTSLPYLQGLNQPNEIAADSRGCISVLDTGRARSPQAYRWTEEGGLWLLDFFARLDRASGSSPWLGFLRTHPNPGLRIPIVQGVAATWHLQHGA